MTTKTSRRAILAGAASLPSLAVPAVSLPAIAETTDPIFAAIKRHRQLEANFSDALRAVPQTGEQEIISAAEDAAGEPGDDASEAFDALVAMTPATVAECAALLCYIERREVAYSTSALFSNRSAERGNPGANLLSRIAGVLAVQS